jgi:hypothetical protein
VNHMAKETIFHPDELLQQLKAGAKSPRTVRSLDIVHEACKEQHQHGSNDFSYGMIGRLSEEKGGPKAQPIRNASGAVYRTLIDAWAKFTDGKTRKPPAPRATGLEDDVLSLIGDPVARILVQNYISENKKLKSENQVLKVAAKEKIVIDLSGSARSCGSGFEAVTPNSLLLDQERAALRSAISPDTLRKQGWTINERTGAITKGPLSIFSPGFVTGLRKILGDTEA